MSAALAPPGRPVAIVGGARVPFARSYGAYARETDLSLLTAALRALVARFDLTAKTVGEVCAGAVIKHPRDWNLTREASLSAGLHPHTPAYDVQRACGTSLTTAIQIGQRIALGEIEAGIAGGTDTTSDVPLSYGRALNRIVLDSARGKSYGARLRPWLRIRPADLKPVTPGVVEPRTGLSMGEHCERMAKQWRIGRAEQDELANRSHMHAAAALIWLRYASSSCSARPMRHCLAISSQCSPIDRPVRGSTTPGAAGFKSAGRMLSHGRMRAPHVLPRALSSTIRFKARP